jgi:CrcB protein
MVAWVALGSAFGASARWGLGMAFASGSLGFPWGTLLANVSGSLLIGLYAALSAPEGRMAASPAQRQFVMTGFCGGFTTFSLFSAEVLRAMVLGMHAQAGLIVLVSIPLWLLGVWTGHALGTRFNRLPIIREERS